MHILGCRHVLHKHVDECRNSLITRWYYPRVHAPWYFAKTRLSAGTRTTHPQELPPNTAWTASQHPTLLTWYSRQDKRPGRAKMHFRLPIAETNPAVAQFRVGRLVLRPCLGLVFFPAGVTPPFIENNHRPDAKVWGQSLLGSQCAP
eukprot:COSAG02_NODE_6469_length_3552_cov_14.721720_3_plen_147_part_00